MLYIYIWYIWYIYVIYIYMRISSYHLWHGVRTVGQARSSVNVTSGFSVWLSLMEKYTDQPKCFLLGRKLTMTGREIVGHVMFSISLGILPWYLGFKDQSTTKWGPPNDSVQLIYNFNFTLVYGCLWHANNELVTGLFLTNITGGHWGSQNHHGMPHLAAKEPWAKLVTLDQSGLR